MYSHMGNCALPQLGFPIRTSTINRLLAAHRSFSQLATSFFGSQCQGIRPMLFVSWPLTLSSSCSLIFKSFFSYYFLILLVIYSFIVTLKASLAASLFHKYATTKVVSFGHFRLTIQFLRFSWLSASTHHCQTQNCAVNTLFLNFRCRSPINISIYRFVSYAVFKVRFSLSRAAGFANLRLSTCAHGDDFVKADIGRSPRTGWYEVSDGYGFCCFTEFIHLCK